MTKVKFVLELHVQGQEPKVTEKEFQMPKTTLIRKLKKQYGMPGWFWYELSKNGCAETHDENGNAAKYRIEA